jgi:GNAT superfamily N-acetyltransferase
MQIQIERASSSQMPALMELIGQSDMSPGTRLTADEMSDLYNALQTNPWQELYAVTRGGDVVGVFSLLFMQHLSHGARRSLVVSDVVVNASFQGQGIGRRMMEFAIARAEAMNCYKIGLSSGKQRTEAHDFYEKLGFEQHGISFYLPMKGQMA